MGWIVFGAILWLIVWICVAAEFRNIAAMKGHDESKYFWWTFLLGPVGMMMVIALPQQIHIPAASAPIVQAPPAQPKKALADELPDI